MRCPAPARLLLAATMCVLATVPTGLAASRAPTASPVASYYYSPSQATAPTLPVAPSSAPTTQKSRVSSEEACYTQGRGINCDWNPRILQDTGYASACEPSAAYAYVSTTDDATITRCAGLSNATCTFDARQTCLFMNSSTCQAAPLAYALRKLKALLQAAPAVLEVLTRGGFCAQQVRNTTCLKHHPSRCAWLPAPDTPSVLKDSNALDNPLGVTASPTTVVQVRLRAARLPARLRSQR
jgi:hypothetical protein